MGNSLKLSAKDITLIGLMVAIIEVCKVLMKDLPNIELTTFWIIMFTLYFGKKIIYVVPTFIIIEGTMFGFGMWWIMYLYLWPLLALVTWVFRKNNSAWFWAVIAGIFGLFFGFFGSFPYIVTSGPLAAFTWWIQGIPWDITHAVANFVLMLVLYQPIRQIMNRVNNMLIAYVLYIRRFYVIVIEIKKYRRYYEIQN